jgi:hypothetical protein
MLRHAPPPTHMHIHSPYATQGRKSDHVCFLCVLLAVPSTPRGNTGRTLAIPPSLPGFSFGPENLLILIGELLLHKIDLDAASDERLLMSTTAAAAGVASASSTTASSRAASRPATAASRLSTASASAGNSGGVAAAAAAGVLLGALDEEGQGSTGPLRGGSPAAVAAWWSTRFRKDLEGAVFDYFMTRCGTADVHTGTGGRQP